MLKAKQKTLSVADRRIWEIDFVRGVLIIGMLVDHFMFFLGMFGGLYAEGIVPSWLQGLSDFAYHYWRNEAKIAVRFIGLFLFFLLTGISSKFSRSNLKRSLICIGFGIFLSLVYMTYSLISGNRYYSIFGVITCLGVCMLLYWAGKALYLKLGKDEKYWKWWALGIGIAMSIAGFIMNLCVSTDLRFGHIFLSMFGEFNPNNGTGSNNPLTFGTAIQTIIGSYAWGNDWLGILPYLGFTFIGGFVGEHIYANRKSIFLRKDPEKNQNFNAKAIRKTWVINWLGAKTFIIYVIHPVVIVLFLGIIFFIATGRLPF